MACSNFLNIICTLSLLQYNIDASNHPAQLLLGWNDMQDHAMTSTHAMYSQLGKNTIFTVARATASNRFKE